MSHKDAGAGFLSAIRAKCVVVISRNRLWDAPDTVVACGSASHKLAEDMSCAKANPESKGARRPQFHSLLAH